MEEKISAVKNKFENADENTVRELIAEYGQSDKAGIIKLVAKYQKQLDMLEAERERVCFPIYAVLTRQDADRLQARLWRLRSYCLRMQGFSM